MTKIKLDLHGKNVVNKVADGSTIAPLLKNDSNAQIKAAGNALLSANQLLDQKNSDNTLKHNAAAAANTALHAQETLYDDAMKAAAAKVIEIYPKNPDKWQALGFAVSLAAATAPAPAQVQNLSVTHGDSSTLNDLHWDSIKGVSAYKIAFCVLDPTVEANWKPADPDISTKSSVTVTILPLVQTWFRVLAINAAGQGAWSNPAKVSA